MISNPTLFILITILESTAAVNCPSGWAKDISQGRCFVLHTFKETLKREKGTWLEASNFCEASGAALTTVHNEYQDLLLKDLLFQKEGLAASPGIDTCWIGLKKYNFLKPSQAWIWNDRKIDEYLVAQDYTNWEPQTADNWLELPPDDKCAAVTPNGWSERPCTGLRSKLSCFSCASPPVDQNIFQDRSWWKPTGNIAIPRVMTKIEAPADLDPITDKEELQELELPQILVGQTDEPIEPILNDKPPLVEEEPFLFGQEEESDTLIPAESPPSELIELIEIHDEILMGQNEAENDALLFDPLTETEPLLEGQEEESDTLIPAESPPLPLANLKEEPFLFGQEEELISDSISAADATDDLESIVAIDKIAKQIAIGASILLAAAVAAFGSVQLQNVCKRSRHEEAIEHLGREVTSSSSSSSFISSSSSNNAV